MVATSATTGARKVSATVPIVPATKLPSAAVASAAAARPARAILLPSSAEIIDALSPGVLSRIDVVEPPCSAGNRCGLDTASARTVPALICDEISETPEMPIVDRPDSRVLSASPPPECAT